MIGNCQFKFILYYANFASSEIKEVNYILNLNKTKILIHFKQTEKNRYKTELEPYKRLI